MPGYPCFDISVVRNRRFICILWKIIQKKGHRGFCFNKNWPSNENSSEIEIEFHTSNLYVEYTIFFQTNFLNRKNLFFSPFISEMNTNCEEFTKISSTGDYYFFCEQNAEESLFVSMTKIPNFSFVFLSVSPIINVFES